MRPYLSDRKLWRKYLKRLCIYGNLLLTSLGRWTTPTHQLWETMKDEKDECLLRYYGGLQRKMGMIGRDSFSKYGTIMVDPIKGMPVQCVSTLFKYRITTSAYDKIQMYQRNSIFACEDAAIKKTLGYVKSHRLRTLQERWTEGDRWVCGTDGGLKYGIGTTGVTLFNQSLNEELCVSMAAEECAHDQLHSTREK